MSLKIHPLVATLVIACFLILIFALFKGCKQNRMEVAAKQRAAILADSALNVLREYKSLSDSSAKDFQDTIEFERGQREFIANQKARTEKNLDSVLVENIKLIDKHKLAKYADTAAITVPNEYVRDCESCFTKLETTTNLSLRYKSDNALLQNKWKQQELTYQNRFKQLEVEQLGFYNKISALTKEQKENAEKLKPHGKLFLSWGVMWSPWPIAGGAGLMYQTKYSFQYGVKFYYGNKGSIVETSMHFPLSIKF